MTVFQTTTYSYQRWFQWFMHSDSDGADGITVAGGSSLISILDHFSGIWMLSEIIFRFSTGNVSDTCFQVFIERRVGISEVSLASTHSMFISHPTIMSWMVSDSMSHMLTQSFTSAGIWLLPGDRVRFDYSMKSGINAWAVDIRGWAVAES